MRKMLSAILLVVFGLLTAAPVFALSGEDASKLPACCRRAGAHQCAGSMEHSGAFNQDSGPVRLRAAQAKCPYCPLAASATHTDSVTLSPMLSGLAAPVSRLSVTAQAGPNHGVTRDGSRRKRGPPSTLLAFLLA